MMSQKTGQRSLLDAHEIIPGLWIGSQPDPAALPDRRAPNAFSHLVLCSDQYQPDLIYFPHVTVLRCPFEDTEAAMSMQTLCMVMLASAAVCEAHRRGGMVLVTCAAGINRSALVTCLAMQMNGMSAEQSVRQIRQKRFSYCLRNETFLRIALGTNRQTGLFLRPALATPRK